VHARRPPHMEPQHSLSLTHAHKGVRRPPAPHLGGPTPAQAHTDTRTHTYECAGHPPPGWPGTGPSMGSPPTAKGLSPMRTASGPLSWDWSDKPARPAFAGAGAAESVDIV